ncbi:MAG: hypothetical protein H8E30_06385 [Alphaproteobacteria bacterium]|nr:hypothetical protein [Alphaproteobacteria bacterium]
MHQHPGTIEDRLADFLSAVRDALGGAIKPDADTRVAVETILTKLPMRLPIHNIPTPGRNEACGTFEAALNASEAGPAHTARIARALRFLEPHCRWLQNPNYTARNQGAKFKAGQAYILPVGPVANHGLTQSGDLLVSTMLMAPGVHYREHVHPAPEVYFILSGESFWRRGEEPWRRHGAGALIHHAPNQIHTTQSDTAPLLCLAIWYRDITSHAKVV